MGADGNGVRTAYFEHVDAAREVFYRRWITELPAGAARFFGLLADGELRHGRPRRTRRYLAQAQERLTADQPLLADEIERFSQLLRQWPDQRIRGQGLGDLVLASGLQQLALGEKKRRGTRTSWEMHQLAVLSARRVLPPDHPQLVDLELHLADALAKADRRGEALKALGRARSIARRLPFRALGAFCSGQFAKVFALAGQRERAERWLGRSLSAYLAVFAADHPALLPTLRRARFFAGGNAEECRRLEAWIAEILETHLGRQGGRHLPVGEDSSGAAAGETEEGDVEISLEE